MTIVVISRWDVTPLRGYFRGRKAPNRPWLLASKASQQRPSCNVLTGKKQRQMTCWCLAKVCEKHPKCLNI